MSGTSRDSMSTKTGFAPTYSTLLAVAAKVSEGTSTSSPGPIPAASRMRCSAAVQELTATQSGRPWAAAKASSKARTRGPIVIQPLSTTSDSAVFSSAPRTGSDTSNIVSPQTRAMLTPNVAGRSGRRHDLEGRQLVVPGKFLRGLEVFDPPDVEPQSVMGEGVG